MILKFVIVSIIVYFFAESVTFVESDESAKPSESLSEEYCADLKGSMKNGSIEIFMKTVNIQWQVDGGPQSNDACQELLNQLFVNCGIETQTKLALRRPIPIKKKFVKPKTGKIKPEDTTVAVNSDETTTGAAVTEGAKTTAQNASVNAAKNASVNVPTEDAGLIDIRTLDEKFGNFVVKFRFGKRSSCASLGPLVKMLDVEMFKNLYPQKKVTLLALSFNPKSGPTLNDWIVVWAKDEEIIDAVRHSSCLEQPEFKDLKYKDKHMLEYFKNETTTKTES